MAEPTFPPPPGISGGSTLEVLSTDDTFVVWFDRTNALINAVNPIEIYGLTASAGGSNDGITLAIDYSTGIYTVGFSTPAIIYGNTEFVDGIEFSGDFVNFSGGTVDFTGSTLYGNVVRTFNGETGDVVFSANASLPGGANGQILVYNADGATWQAQNFFMGVTTDVILAGPSGGIILGATSGDAGNFYRKGTIQLAGGTAPGILFRDDSQTNAFQRGIFLSYDDKSLTIKGGDTAGSFDTNTASPYVNISTDERRLGLFGVTTPEGSVHYRSRGGTPADILLETSGGNTLGLHFPSDTLASVDLNEVDELRFDFQNNSNNQGAVRFLGGTAGVPLNSLYINQVGDVVVGAAAKDSSGSSGSFNIASGDLRVGGLTGQDTYVLTSTGLSAAWKEAAGGGFEQVSFNDVNFAGSTNPNNFFLNAGNNINLTGSSAGSSVGADISSFFDVRINTLDINEDTQETPGSTAEGINIQNNGGLNISAQTDTVAGKRITTYFFEGLGSPSEGGADGITGLQALFIEGAASPSVTGPSFEGLDIRTTGSGVTMTFTPGNTTGILNFEIAGSSGGGGATGATGGTGDPGATGATGAGVTSASLTTFANGGQTLSFITENENGITTSITAGFITGFVGATGATGAIGSTGATGNAGFRYTFTANASPNAGELNYTKANGFNINRITLDNLNISNYISGITTNDKALVISSGGTAFASVDLLTRTLGAVNQIYGTTADAGTFVAGDTVFLTYSKAGLTGSIGNDGAAGDAGATGATGAGITSASLTALAGGGQTLSFIVENENGITTSITAGFIAGVAGNTGATGETGSVGATGATGQNAGFRYLTKNSNASGNIQVNGSLNPDIVVSITSADGASLTDYLISVDANRNDKVFVQSADGSSHYSGRVSEVVDNSGLSPGRVRFNLTNTTGTYPSVDGDVFLYYIAGATGDPGATGATGALGSTGNTGATGSAGFPYKLISYSTSTVNPTAKGTMSFDINDSVLRINDDDRDGRDIRLLVNGTGFPDVGDTLQVNFNGIEFTSVPGYVAGVISDITLQSGYIEFTLDPVRAFPPTTQTLQGDELGFLNFMAAGAQGPAGADGNAGSPGAAGPISPFRFVIDEIGTGVSLTPGDGKLSVDINGSGSVTPSGVPFITFNQDDQDDKDIQRYLTNFLDIGDMIHISSKDVDYYGFGKVNSIDTNNRRVFINGFTSDGNFAADVTEVTVLAAKRGETGGAAIPALNYTAGQPGDDFGGAGSNIDTLGLFAGDGISIVVQRDAGEGVDGGDRARYTIVNTATDGDAPSGSGQYISHISRLGYVDLLGGSVRSCTFDNQPSSFNDASFTGPLNTSGGSGKSSVFNGGVIIPFPIVEAKSASGSQGGDALVQQNAGNSDIVNSQSNNALSVGVGGTPQYITGDLWEVGTNLTSGQFDPTVGQGGGILFVHTENQGFRVIRYDITLRTLTSDPSGVGFAVIKGDNAPGSGSSTFTAFEPQSAFGIDQRGKQPGSLTDIAYGVSDSDSIFTFQGITNDTREVSIEIFDTNSGSSEAYWLVAYPIGNNSPEILGGRRKAVIVEKTGDVSSG